MSDRGLEPAARREINASALRSERVIAVIRILFCVAVVTRSALIWTARGWAEEGHRAFIAFPAMALAIGFSAYVLARGTRPGRSATKLVLASVTIDALVIFAALLPNVLWPWPGYLGLIHMPDLVALLLASFAAGLRLSPRAAVLGAVLNTASYTTLVAIDYSVTGDTTPGAGDPFVLWGILIAVAGALAVALSVQTRRVVARAARQSVRAERTRSNLNEILRDHHEMRSLFASLSVNAELLGRHLEQAPSKDARLLELAGRLGKDAASCVEALQQIRERTLEDVLALEQHAAVQVASVVDEVIEAIAPRFGNVSFVREVDTARTSIAGGVASLRRLLFNLLVNACEGDGSRGAQRVRVEVSCQPSTDAVVIRISDDGPGFASAILEQQRLGSTTKAYGSGMGLPIASAVARASRGALRLANHPDGGALVTVELPAAQIKTDAPDRDRPAATSPRSD